MIVTVQEGAPADMPPIGEMAESVALPGVAVTIPEAYIGAVDVKGAKEAVMALNAQTADLALAKRAGQPSREAEPVKPVEEALANLARGQRRSEIAGLLGVCGLSDLVEAAIAHAEAHHLSARVAINSVTARQNIRIEGLSLLSRSTR